MPTKQDVTNAHELGVAEGIVQERAHRITRLERESGYPAEVTNVLALIDGLHARGVSHNDLHQIVVAWLEAARRHA